MNQPGQEGKNERDRAYCAKSRRIVKQRSSQNSHAIILLPNLVLSLLLNLAVFPPVCTGLLSNAAGHGPVTVRMPARRVLLSVYVAIGAVSLVLLCVDNATAVATLLLVQIVYKLTTPLTVWTVTNLVVVSKLAIPAFHVATLGVMWRVGAPSGSAD